MTVLTVRRLPATRLDRDGLEHFFESARSLVPGGEIVQRIEIRDGDRMAAYATLDELYSAPHLPDRLTDVSLGMTHFRDDAPTHALVLHAVDDRLELQAWGDEIWAHGATGVVGDVIDVYGQAPAAAQRRSIGGFTAAAQGITAASTIAVLLLRGTVPALVVLAILAVAWFALDLALNEIVRASIPVNAAQPLVLDIRPDAQRAATRRLGARLVAFERAGALALVAIAAASIAALLPHVPATWGNL